MAAATLRGIDSVELRALTAAPVYFFGDGVLAFARRNGLPTEGSEFSAVTLPRFEKARQAKRDSATKQSAFGARHSTKEGNHAAMRITEKAIHELILYFSRDEKTGVEVFRMVMWKTQASADYILRLIKNHYPKLVPSLVLAKILPSTSEPKQALNKPKSLKAKSPQAHDIYDLPPWKRRGGYKF